MTVANYKKIVPDKINSAVIQQKPQNRIEANLIISDSINGAIYNLTLDEPKLLSDATNTVDFFQRLDTEDVEFVKIFHESTQCGNDEHVSGRIEVCLKDKSVFMIHCRKIHGLPK